MAKMIATRTFPYQGRVLKKGDVFEPRNTTHARQLRGANFAADAVKRGRPPKVVEVESVTTVVKDETNENPVPAKSDETYQTRVMTAQD